MFASKTLNFVISLLIVLMMIAANIGTAQAYDRSQSYKHSYKKYSSNKQPYSKKTSDYQQRQDYAQKQYRSRSSVIAEVKSRYNAKVLKISLNEKSGIYYVRVLMPNGKIRSLQINAGG